ncbi:hypothetical protein ES703_82129 [subsurface metagenome]
MHLIFAEDIFRILFALDFNLIQRRLGDINHTLQKQLRHLPEEKRQQQCSNMRAIDVSVCHQYYLAVSAPAQIELVGADAGP